MKEPAIVSEIVLIAAVSENNVIGVDGNIPWHKDRKKNQELIKDDFDHFKKLTVGYPIVMGRVTYESIPPKFRPLPGRQNVVLTGDVSFREKDVYISRSLEEALHHLGDRRFQIQGIDYSKVFIGGGQQVYEAAMPYATSLEITKVQQQVEGRELRYFPKIDPAQWQEQKREDKQGYSFVTYARK
ncbi:MAG: dihydrofolate reductase [Nanoarchaeota archaeon]|nr:dihydrofolate reductase [Nanoarchaeota archaeon]